MAPLSDLLFTGAALLGTVVTGREPSTEPFQLNGGGATTVLIYLVLLVGIAGAVIFLVRKNRIGAVKGNGRLSILESRMLGGRQFLVVGKYDGKTFLLGVCPGRIDYLCSLEDQQARADSREADFSAMLGKEEKKPTL